MLKDGGTMKKKMKHFTLPELQERHHQMLQAYEFRARPEIKQAIKERRLLPMYVLDIEADEMKKLVSLEIVSITPEVSNPFHGVLQSSKERILIHAERPKGVDTLGLMV